MKIQINEDAYNKIMFWTEKADFEVSGLGLVTIEDKVLTIQDAILVKQEGSAAETEMSGDAINNALYTHRKKKGDIRLWWHSHVNMGVFASATDQNTIRELGEHGWFISLIVNKSGDTYLAYYQGTPFRMFAEKIELEIMSDVNIAWEKKMTKEFTDNVTEKVYKAPNNQFKYKGDNPIYSHNSDDGDNLTDDSDSSILDMYKQDGCIVRSVDGGTGTEVYIPGYYRTDDGRGTAYLSGHWESVPLKLTPREHLEAQHPDAKHVQTKGGVWIPKLGLITDAEIEDLDEKA